jgi:2',3'-cyclic-nucleotide 2'-phosphodiesterase (5'-nucleotidase family)
LKETRFGWVAVFAFAAFTTAMSSAFSADPVNITLLHTNDLHAHFRPENTPLALGGIARIKTAVDRIRSTTPNTLFVDGGDWSEGDIYYTEGAGSAVLKMMDTMGYDIAVVGNHDWLNGPDTLLNAIDQANSKVSLIVANFDTSAYNRSDEFQRKITPYVIRNIGGAKVAFIGLATYEFIYDKYISPIKITDPFSLTRDLAHKLKQVVDAVVVISHNRVSYNKALLKAAPDVDLVIGAHDHVKLTTPTVVARSGAPAGWIVETGCWGRYLGRVDMQVTPRSDGNPSIVNLKQYQLIQMDRTIPFEPVVNSKIASIEAAIEHRMGPVFHDRVGQTQIELSRDGNDVSMGNFATDAYRAATGADLALDLKSFMYGNIHQGNITSAQLYNSNPAVYNPQTEKTWTLKTLPMKGKTLSWIFRLLLFKNLSIAGTLYTSGADILFNGTPKDALPVNSGPTSVLFGMPFPTLATNLTDRGENGEEDQGNIQSALINGRPLRDDDTYLVTAGGGIFESLDVLDQLLPDLIPTDGMKDTGIETWRAVGDYVKAKTPVTSDKIEFNHRVETVQPDLGIYYNDVNWTPIKTTKNSITAKISVQVHNFGATASPGGAYLILAKNRNGNNLAIQEAYTPLAQQIALDPLGPGESKTYDQTVTLTPDRGVYSLAAMIRGNGFEANHGNDDVLRYFTVSKDFEPDTEE